MAYMSQTGYVLVDKQAVATTVLSYSTWCRVGAEEVTIQTCLATKPNAQDFVYIIEGKFDTIVRPASIYCNRMSGKDTRDRLYTVTPKPNYIRIAYKNANTIASKTASANIFYAGIGLSERR